MSDAPFDTLVAQHHDRLAVLDDIRAAIGRLEQEGPGQGSSEALYQALARLPEKWRPHIALKEAQFTRESLDAVCDSKEEAQFGKAIAD